jgi:hypothetical protein
VGKFSRAPKPLRMLALISAERNWANIQSWFEKGTLAIGPAAISAQDPLMPCSREPIHVLIKPVLNQNLSQPVVRSIPKGLDYHHCWRSTDTPLPLSPRPGSMASKMTRITAAFSLINVIRLRGLARVGRHGAGATTHDGSYRIHAGAWNHSGLIAG